MSCSWVRWHAVFCCWTDRSSCLATRHHSTKHRSVADSAKSSAKRHSTSSAMSSPVCTVCTELTVHTQKQSKHTYAHATMILVRLTDYNDDLMYHFFSLLSIHFIVFVWCRFMFFFTSSHMFICHAELKDYISQVITSKQTPSLLRTLQSSSLARATLSIKTLVTIRMK